MAVQMCKDFDVIAAGMWTQVEEVHYHF